MLFALHLQQQGSQTDHNSTGANKGCGSATSEWNWARARHCTVTTGRSSIGAGAVSACESEVGTGQPSSIAGMDDNGPVAEETARTRLSREIQVKESTMNISTGFMNVVERNLDRAQFTPW